MGAPCRRKYDGVRLGFLLLPGTLVDPSKRSVAGPRGRGWPTASRYTDHTGHEGTYTCIGVIIGDALTRVEHFTGSHFTATHERMT